MNNTKLYYIIFFISVFISSLSQILLKKSTQKVYKNRINEYLNFKVITAYGIFFLSSLLTVISYKKVPLSVGPVIEATGYIYIAILSYIILKEKMGIKKVIGNLLILVGIGICVL